MTRIERIDADLIRANPLNPRHPRSIRTYITKQVSMNMITAKTSVVGLIGWPVSHSVSPAMHNAAFAHLGLDWAYLPLPVDPARPDAVAQAVLGLRALGLRGANVTVPHKQAVMPALDQLTPAAQAIGAVNTIVVAEDGALLGDNTDAPGFIADLREHGVDPAGLNVLVLGAGGSARAVVYGLADAGARTIVIANRTVARAATLASALGPQHPGCRIAAIALDNLPAHAAGADLIVNCTALGMTPQVESSPWPEDLPFRAEQVVYDLVYNPRQTRLLQQAAAAGAQAIGGIGMLVWQGALAFQRWTGQPAPVAVMRAAVDAAQLAAAAPPPFAGVVRQATADDAAAIAAINRQVQAMHAAAVPDFFKPPTAATFPPEFWRERLTQPDVFILVAELAGAVIGYLYADTAPTIETPHTYARPRCFIHQLGVDDAHRHQGAGAALLAAAKAHARAQGITLLALTTWAFNEQAVRFFTRAGFAVYNYRMWMTI
jgi:shikimate dehydrogenase